MKRKEEGVTLVALVVTIVVLMILSSLSIYFAFSEDGLMQSTKEAKFREEVLEIINTAEAIKIRNNGVLTRADLEERVTKVYMNRYFSENKLKVEDNNVVYDEYENGFTDKENEWLLSIFSPGGQITTEIVEVSRIEDLLEIAYNVANGIDNYKGKRVVLKNDLDFGINGTYSNFQGIGFMMKDEESDMEMTVKEFVPEYLSQIQQMQSLTVTSPDNYNIYEDLFGDSEEGIDVILQMIYEKSFSGIFDGGGYTIYNVPPSSFSYQFTSESPTLFQFLAPGSVVKNLTISGSPGSNVGTIATMNDKGTISGCKITGTNCSSLGITLINYGKIENSCNEVDTKIAFGWGSGIAVLNTGDITGCYNSGKVLAQKMFSDDPVTVIKGIAGIAGINSGNISYCYNTAAINESKEKVSMAAGICVNNERVVESCYNKGLVYVYYDEASDGIDNISSGIIGFNVGSVYNCYNTGKIDGMMAAGIVGMVSAGVINNCNNTGIISAITSEGNSLGGGVLGLDLGVLFGIDVISLYRPEGMSMSINECYYWRGSALSGTPLYNDTESGINRVDRIEDMKSILYVVNKTKQFVIDESKNGGDPILKWQQ